MAFVPVPYRALVYATEELGPTMRAVTVGGPGLAEWRSTGHPDEWVHLGLPGGTRMYSIRDHRSDPVEIRLEVSLHSSGPAAQWARTVRPGAEVVISQPVGRYAPPVEARWQLIVADHAGLPAAARIVAEAPAGAPMLVCLAVDDATDYPWPDSAAEVRLHRLIEPDPDRAGQLLAETALGLDWPAGPGYVWLAAETGCARQLRRHLRRTLGWPSTHYDVVGYWQRRSTDYDRRYAEVADRVAALHAAGPREGGDVDDVLLEIETLLDAHGL